MCAVVLGQINYSGCHRCSIRHQGICRSANENAIEELEQIAHVRRFPRGETIVAEGEPMSAVGNVVSGVLKASKYLPDGREQVVDLLMEFDVFGRIDSEPLSYALESSTEVELCLIDRRSFRVVLDRYPDLRRALFRSMLEQLDRSREWMAWLATKSVLERLAGLLIMLRRRASLHHPSSQGTSDALVIDVPVGRRDLAAFLATTVESISRNVRELERREVIRIVHAQRFEVADLDTLNAISGTGTEGALTDGARPASEPLRAPAPGC